MKKIQPKTAQRVGGWCEPRGRYGCFPFSESAESDEFLEGVPFTA